MGCRPPRTGTQPAPIFTASWRFAFCTAMVFSFLRRVRRKGPHRRALAYLCCPGLCPRQSTSAETGGVPVYQHGHGLGPRQSTSAETGGVPVYQHGHGLGPRQSTGAKTGGVPVRQCRHGCKKPHAFCQGRLFSGGEEAAQKEKPARLRTRGLCFVYHGPGRGRAAPAGRGHSSIRSWSFSSSRYFTVSFR